jgi:DNA-directed RNA polymerase specialized sigma24 family protein
MAYHKVFRHRVPWHHPPSLRGFLRIVTTRMVYEWWAANPIASELRDEDAVLELNAERLTIARDMLRFLREATTPERWRAVRARAQGIPAHAIAQREGIPTATIYTRLRDAAEDFRAALARDDAAIWIRRRR